MEFDPKRVCFLGNGQTALTYYRCMLPALEMGADWVGVVGEPPKLRFATGMVRDRSTGSYTTRAPDLLGDDYDIVVIQQPYGASWVKLIDALRERGTIVVCEMDDYVHAIPSEEDHQFKAAFTRTFLSDVEWAMRHCDALITSTDYIASHYRHFNRRTFVCRNGIDLKRYDLSRPKRGTVNIGWAGATGHFGAVEPWFAQVGHIMRMRENTCFVSVGRLDFAAGFERVFGKDRVIGTPWAAIEQYPGAMTMIDIALAPASHTSWWKGKSDLRWLEAAALGITVVADPQNYGEIKHGETGFLAYSPQEAAEYMLTLVDDRKLRRKVGKQGRQYIRENRGMDTMVEQWKTTFTELLDDAG